MYETEEGQSLDAILAKLQGYADSENIAEDLEDDELQKLGITVKQEYEVDRESRADWEDVAEKAMEVAKQVRKNKSFPFHMASNVKYPLITVAALQFGARAYPAICDGNNIVKGAPVGDDKGTPVTDADGMVSIDPQTQQPQWKVEPGAKRAKAQRIGEHMSYQLVYEMEEWEEDTDVLLHHIPIIGCAFRKVYRDPIEQRNRAEMVRAMDLVVNNKTTSLHDCPRITQEFKKYPHEIEQLQRDGIYLDVELPEPAGDDKDAAHELLEQHRLIDLDKDGYREPYIVTICKESSKVLRIVANYDFDEIEHDGEQIIRVPRDQYFVKYAFLPDPEGGFYDVGFGRLLESISGTIDSVINQMIDAGTLQNAGGGFIGSGVRLKKGKVEFAPGRYTQVESSNLRDSIYNFEHPGPSATSFAVLELMLSAATDITGVKDIFTGDTGDKGVQTATTTLALIEQGMKVFTAIYKRIYRALRQEFKLLFRLNSKHLSDEEYFTVMDSQQSVAREDYDFDTVDVMPVADPRMVTDMQKLARSQAYMPLVEAGLVDPREATKRFLERIGEDNVDALLPKQQQNPMMEEAAMTELLQMKENVRKTSAEADKIEKEAGTVEQRESREDFKADMTFEEGQEKLAQEAFGKEADLITKEAELQQKAKELEKRPANGSQAA